ncbi:hypothetical protein PF003_g27549 [Phytophthora fragariae]|nr:hypothetical protein PF003_g27549 [Phytophthora fragariae]
MVSSTASEDKCNYECSHLVPDVVGASEFGLPRDSIQGMELRTGAKDFVHRHNVLY